MVSAFIVDSFTEQPFSGNPAAVCLLDRERDPSWMQRVAAEFNLSETAFITPQKEGFGLQWFTPEVEVELCGHATLASAHILQQEGRLAPDQPILFRSKRYELICYVREDGIAMEFPIEIPKPAEAPEGLLDALGVTEAHVERNHANYMVVLPTADAIYSLIPDWEQLGKIEARGIIVTALSDRPEWDFISRFFAIRVGIREDPVTGSAHCGLAPYWAKRLGKHRLIGYQASKRGGMIAMTLEKGGVTLSGKAHTTFVGELLA